MADKPYDPNDPSTWGPIVGKDPHTGQPVYANQPGAGGAAYATAAPVSSDPGYSWSTPGHDVSLALGAVSPDFVTNLFGGGGGPTAGEKQTALAQNTVSPSNIQAGDIYNRAIAQANSANAIQAPDKVVTSTLSSANVDPGAYYARTDTNAKAADATFRMQAYEAAQAQASQAAINNVKQANVTNVAATPQAAVGNINTTVAAPTVGNAAQTGLVTVDRASLDPMANQLRQAQIRSAQDISNSPSAAMAQFQAGQSQVVKDQLAIAAASRGAERAGARREAMINVGANGAQQNLAAAALAAQEEQAKRVASASALSNIRSQDVTSATNAASIQSQQANLQAQLDSAIAQGNTSAINAIKQQQAQLALQARQSEVQAGLGQQSTQASLAQANLSAQEQTNLANAAAANKSASDYAAAWDAAYNQMAQNQTTVSLANAGATTAASAANTGAYNSAAQQAATNQTNVNLANTALAQKQAQDNATRAAGIASQNALQTNAINGVNASNSIGTQTTNAANQLATNQLQQQAATSALNVGNIAIGNETKNAQTVVDANKAGASADAATDAATKGMIAAGIAKLSDERAKQDVQKLSPYDTRHWADSIDPITFRYKDGYEDSGKDVQLGVSAQQVKKSGPLGKLMVHEDPQDNLDHVDYGALTLMLSKTALDVANEALERAKGKQARRAS
jgi:hypothetical protein